MGNHWRKATHHEAEICVCFFKNKMSFGQVGISLHFVHWLIVCEPGDSRFLKHDTSVSFSKLKSECWLARRCPVNSPITTVQMPAIKINVHETIFTVYRKT